MSLPPVVSAPSRPLATLEQPGLLLPPSHPGGVGTYEFHRLTWLNPHKHWWRPFAVAAIAGAVFVVASLVAGVVAGILIAQFDPTQVDALRALLSDGSAPATLPVLLFMLTSVAIMLPILYVGYLATLQRNLGYLWSVAGRFRWRWFAACLGVAVALQGGWLVASLALDGSLAPSTWEPAPLPDHALLLGILAFAVLLPLQCAAEEFVFRGFLMQAVGTWVKHPAVAIGAQIPLFVLGHLYGGWAMLDIALFALAAGWLAWRTGGLEAPLALHLANNAAAFFVSTAVAGSIDPTETGDLPSVLASGLVMAVFVGIVEVMQRRANLSRVAVIAPTPGVSYVPVQALDYRGMPLEVQVPLPAQPAPPAATQIPLPPAALH